MPDGAGSPEILPLHQTPAAGKQKPKTEEEKQKEREQKELTDRQKRKEFIGQKLEQKEVLEEANSEQRAKIEAFQKKAKEKAIENWSADELKDAVKEMFTLGEELHGEGADEELKDLVREYEYYVVDELYEKIGDEARRFHGKLLEGTPEKPDPVREAWKMVNERRKEPISLEELRTQQMLIERGIYPLAGAADRIDEAGITDPQLGLRVRTANRLLEDIPDDNFQEQAQVLQQLQNSLSSLIGVDQTQQEQLLDRVTDRLVELRRQIRTEERRRETEREETGRRMGREEQPEQFLTEEDLDRGEVAGEERFTAASYATANPRIRAIADEIQQTFAGARGEARVTNEYLREKLTDLARILGEPLLADEVSEQGYRLQRDLWRLKDILSAKIATRATLEGRGLYAEIRMGPADKRAIVELASRADPNGNSGEKEAWRDLEKEFNRRFTRADVNSSDDWRDALGPGGSIEIDEFITTLANAGENVTSLRGRLLTPEEQDKVRECIRRLKQELKLREYLHSLTYFVNTNASAEDIIKAGSRFVTEEAQVAFQKRGVAQMYRIYEQAMLEIVARNGGYLPAKAMINNPDGTYGDVEKLVLEMATRAKGMGVLPEDIEDWEIRRAISLARGMGIVTARWFEIAALHGISKNIPLNSFWANGLVKNIAFFQQVARFNVGQKQNAILGYYLEGRKTKMPWSTDELKRFKAMSQQEIFDIMVNDTDDARLIQMKNPFHIGSIFTQTGWRWKGDKVNLASATARLLKEDPFNPLIGVGLLIEAHRGDLGSTKALNKDKQEEARRILGVNVKTEGERAEAIIRQAIEGANKRTPLKLFNNLISLRQDVLREYYGKGKDRKREPQKDSTGREYIKEDEKDSPGQIIIQSKELQNDLASLALVQENLLRKRVTAYDQYIKEDMKQYEDAVARGENPERPKLDLNSDEYTKLDFEILTASPGDPRDLATQKAAAQALAEHIRFEFTANGNRSYESKLISNLRDKGWKVPWVFGADDIPHESFDYAALTGDTIKRRWDADIGPVVATAGMYGEFISNLTEFKSQEDIVKAMKKMHSTLSAHDASVANDTMRYLAEGVAKFYKKDWVTRLPLGIGKITGFVGGDASYAQVAFGRGQMAWDELDMQGFLQTVHAAGIVDEDQLEELKKRLGSQSWNLAWAMGRSGIPLLLAALVYLFLNEQLEQLKKAA